MTNQEAIDVLQEKISPCVAGKWKEAVDAAISALQAQDVPDTNVGGIYECSCGYGWDKSKVFRHHFCPNCGRAVGPSYNLTKTELNGDMISRQAVIDALERNACSTQRAIEAVEALPSAQPNLQPTCNQLATDVISRQAAIDALCSVCGNDCDKSEFVYDVPQDEQVILCPEHYALAQLPSVTQDRCDTCRFVYYPKEANNNDQ